MLSFTAKKNKTRLLTPLWATLLVPCLMLSACQKNDATQAQESATQDQDMHDHDHEGHDHDHEGHDHEGHDHDHEEHDHDHEGHDHDHEGHDHDHEGHDHDHEGHDHEGHDHAGHHHHHGEHDPANMTKFSCEPENEIYAHYHNDEQPKIVHLLIDGIEYELTETASASGTLYSSEIGLTDDQGIAWRVVDEDDAQLSSFALNGGKADNGKVVFECEKDS